MSSPPLPRPVVKETKEEPLSWSESQPPPPGRLFDGFLPWRSARDRRTERYFAGRLIEVRNGFTKRKGRIERQFSLIPIEGFLKTNVSKLLSRFDFSFVPGILGNSQ